jgi:hypothetical protein
VAKAFDVVHHPLLTMLHTRRLQENWWLMKEECLTNMYNKVVWENNNSLIAFPSPRVSGKVA